MIGVFEGIEVGSWYSSVGGQPFEVVALDLEQETIEIQYFDGSVSELDYDGWLELAAQPANEPGDFDGALDIPHEEYLSIAEPSGLEADWIDPQQLIDRL